MARRKKNEKAQAKGGRLKKYRVTILPNFGPEVVEAESPEAAEELANHYWDMGWDGEFVTETEEIQ